MVLFLKVPVICAAIEAHALDEAGVLWSSMIAQHRKIEYAVACTGDMAGGIALYERASTYNAKHADALYNLGVACGETGQIARAIFLYELAVHFNPACAEAWNNLGVLQRDMGNFERECLPYCPTCTDVVHFRAGHAPVEVM